MTTVVKPWVTETCTWKEQTVLFCALRGPDAGGTPALKSWTRWIRRTVLENAAPAKTFMQYEERSEFDNLAERNPLALDMLPVHYLAHLMHALQVIAYRHPSELPRSIALDAYKELVAFLHVDPEPPALMNERLRDEVPVREDFVKRA